MVSPWMCTEANLVKLTHPVLLKLGALMASSGLRWWMNTVEVKALFADPRSDPVLGGPTRRIYLFWHEYLLLPFYLRGHCDIAILLSRHRDAEILAEVAQWMGFELIRGSTYRGGAEALYQLLRKGRSNHIGITPDGPRGPRRHLAPGALFLASRLDMPIVLIGVGYDRPWRVEKAWDRFAIPRPFSRARMVLSEEIYVPGGLDRLELDTYRHRLEALLNQLTTEAEQWAASGTRKIGDQVLCRQPCRSRSPAASRRVSSEPPATTSANSLSLPKVA